MTENHASPPGGCGADPGVQMRATVVSTAPQGPLTTRPVVLIPAYKPAPILPDLVGELMRSGQIEAVIVVNDGSGPEYQHISNSVRRIEKAHLLDHIINLGKGAALKTGLNYAACMFPGHVGVVTADADGQHSVKDILATAAELAANPDSLILGVREFGSQVPFRSKVGNVLTRHIMRLVTGQNLADTQTGLRGIPMDFIPELMRSRASGYDFELDMLLTCKRAVRKISEIPIDTIYIEGNKSSHFNPVLDSMRIYFLFLRFASVSLLTAGLDNLVFVLAFLVWPNVVGCQAVSRLCAGLFNYYASKTGVFHSRVRHAIALPKYWLSVVVAGALSYLLLTNLVSLLEISVVSAKIAAETIMWAFSFIVQRELVFAQKDGEAER